MLVKNNFEHFEHKMRDDIYTQAKIRCKFGISNSRPDISGAQLCGHVFHVNVPRYSQRGDVFKLFVASTGNTKEQDEHRDKVYEYFQCLRQIIHHYDQHTTLSLVRGQQGGTPGFQFHCGYAEW